MPCGPWEHRATYPLIDLMSGNDEVLYRVTPQLRRILSIDRSQNVVGRASHLARYLPRQAVSSWQEDEKFSQRWTFSDPNELLVTEKRPDLISFIHMGYCLAAQEVAGAVTFMNRCAGNKGVMADAAAWNFTHAMRDRKALIRSMETKLKSDQLDPAIVRIASDPQLFTFLSDCMRASYRVILGDARLKLREAPQEHYGLLVMDAFSSDSVPAHLLTTQALNLYLAKLAPRRHPGVSHQQPYLNLEPLLAGLSRRAGLSAFIRREESGM